MLRANAFMGDSDSVVPQLNENETDHCVGWVALRAQKALKSLCGWVIMLGCICLHISITLSV